MYSVDHKTYMTICAASIAMASYGAKEYLNPLRSKTPLQGTMSNSEYLDGRLAFWKGLHCVTGMMFIFLKCCLPSFG